jgi:hypothetical protein
VLFVVIMILNSIATAAIRRRIGGKGNNKK